MLDNGRLQMLNGWCRQRNMRWTARPAVGTAVSMLLQANQREPWPAVVLVVGSDNIWLTTEQGETLATASDLPALLDAVDGGVCE